MLLQISFIIVSLLSLLLFYFTTGNDKKLLLFFTAWQVITGIAAFTGLFEKTPKLFPVAIAGTILVTVFCFRKIKNQKLNTNLLLFIHVLRIPVEVILYHLYLKGKIPELMTFSGWNFDILMGISAAVLLLYSSFTKKAIPIKFLTVWNIIGLLFLFFIVSLALLSSPLPIQQLAFNQPNVAVLAFPYCFLPTCVVPVVLLSHFLFLSKQKKVLY